MSPRIIIVDDSPAYRRVLQGHLAAGHELLLCESGEEALDRAADFGPDLVLSDLIMRGIDGYELCRRVKTDPALAHVPVILLTSKTDDEAKVTGLEVGADDYLFKPVRPRELIARVQSLLRLRRATLELKAAQDELIRTEKMASLGQLVAGIAHEINNPLNYIYGNVGFLTDYANALLGLIQRIDCRPGLPGMTAEQRAALDGWKREVDLAYIQKDLGKLLEGVRLGAERAAEIVRGLRTFARAGGAPGAALETAEPVDLAKLIDVTLLVLRHELRDRIEVVRDFPDVRPARGDASRLGQVFMNLILNAAHAISDHGQIHISLAAEPDHVRCAIRDTGHGMSAAVRARIFDPFFTTKPVGKGTGLGLSISYGIIQQHGGRIEVDSEEGKGTTFTLHLPAA